MSESELANIVTISQLIGKDPASVQGGGGNTSIKLDERRMVIKASGTLLKNMRVDSGYSVVDYVELNNYLESPDEDENLFIKKLEDLVIETNNRSSMETGFHALLGKCVVHTHSVYANILTCSKEGRSIVNELFPESIWIDYATPGLDLTIVIRDALEELSVRPCILFLQNHGLIVSADSVQESLSLYETINKKIRVYFDLEPALYQESTINVTFSKQSILFPDQVVYILSGSGLYETMAAKETFWAYKFIMYAIKKLNLTPQFIPYQKVETLLNSESEIYRQRVLLS